MKSASNGLMMASTCALLGSGAPIDLKVSTPMMPMTRPLSRRAASMATGPPIEWPTRMICLLGTADSAVATSWPKRAMVQSVRLPSVPPWPARSTVTTRVFLLELRHLLAPVVRIAGPAVDEHQRRFAAAIHAVLHVDAVGRDGDARRAFGGLGLVARRRRGGRRAVAVPACCRRRRESDGGERREQCVRMRATLGERRRVVTDGAARR